MANDDVLCLEIDGVDQEGRPARVLSGYIRCADCSGYEADITDVPEGWKPVRMRLYWRQMADAGRVCYDADRFTAATRAASGGG